MEKVTKVTSIRLKDEEYTIIKEIANKNMRSINKQILYIVREYIKNCHT